MCSRCRMFGPCGAADAGELFSKPRTRAWPHKPRPGSDKLRKPDGKPHSRHKPKPANIKITSDGALRSPVRLQLVAPSPEGGVEVAFLEGHGSYFRFCSGPALMPVLAR